MQLIFNIPDEVLVRVVDGLCDNNGWDPALGISRPNYARLVVIKFIKGNVGSREGTAADRLARQSVENEIIIT